MQHYQVFFLEDYAALAGLPDLDPNYAGMIDQVVASRASVFVGTYFSSFSAYVGRMRGYHGASGKTMYYSHPNYWNQTHSWGERTLDSCGTDTMRSSSDAHSTLSLSLVSLSSRLVLSEGVSSRVGWNRRRR